MRKLSILLILSMVFTSMSFAGFDYVITKFQGSMQLKNNESLLVKDGGTPTIYAADYSYVEVRNTSQNFFGGIGSIIMMDYSTLNYYGGETKIIFFCHQAEVVLQGGKINGLSSFQHIYNDEQGQPIKHIDLICKDYEYTANYYTWQGQTIDLLTGTWMDGTTFQIELMNQQGYASVIDNINIIPEPLTLALMGFGSLLLRRRK